MELTCPTYTNLFFTQQFILERIPYPHNHEAYFKFPSIIIQWLTLLLRYLRFFLFIYHYYLFKRTKLMTF